MDCKDIQPTDEPKSHIAHLFGLEKPSYDSIRLVKILAVLFPSFAVSFQISTTFYMIFIAETLGGGDYIAGLTLVGVLVVVSLGTQTMLDYPTGAIGDWIGQRYVIASALLCYSIAFGITSTIDSTTPFPVFVAIYALMGIGSAQESGAFQAWFDSNWRIAMPHDEDRKIYGVFWGRVGMVWQVSSTLVLIPGSWLALVLNRRWVFQLQAILSVILALAVLRLVKDLPGVRSEIDEQPSLKEYGQLLKDGVKFLGSSKFVTFIILGEVLIWSTGPVWWNLLLFPFYFIYLYSDVAVSSYRTLVFIPEAFMQERSGIWSRRFDPKTWVPRFRILQFGGILFYILLALIVVAFPPPPLDSISLVSIRIPFTDLSIIEMPLQSVIPVTLVFLVFVLTSAFGGFAQILTQRIMIDVIPNRIRNSMYSLQPTLIMLVSMPLIAFFGLIIPETGFPPIFIMCGLITFVGALLIRNAFSHPIPKAEAIIQATQEEREEIDELDVA
ncbi:MFS transporter [Candidatus Thorarchaeota archaeon]|nr:MAG: MFS transporter [Candidatus Thorarchaeota archaeon]